MSNVEKIEIVDLKSAVKNISNSFASLAYDAYHEAIYGMEGFYSTEEWEEMSDKYDKAEYYCELYLENKISISFLVHELIDMEMSSFLAKLKPYLPQNLIILCDLSEDEGNTSIDSDDDGDNNGGKADQVEKKNKN